MAQVQLQSQAIQRITDYPVIRDSLSISQKLVESNAYSNYAFNTTLALSQNILDRLSPVVPYKERADSIANKGLDYFESVLPLTQPTEEIVRRVRAPADNGVAIARDYANGVKDTLVPVFVQPINYVGDKIRANPSLEPILARTQKNLTILQDRLISTIALLPHNKAQAAEAIHGIYKEVEGITLLITNTIKGLPVHVQQAAKPYVDGLTEGVAYVRTEMGRDAPYSEKATNVVQYTRERLEPLLGSIKDLVLTKANPRADNGPDVHAGPDSSTQ